MNNKPKLAEFSHNEYSQFGEDGIIEKILSIIGNGNKTCVEFGAWNGVYDANTAKLWLEKGWKALLIEGDETRFKVLKENIKDYPCICINKYVTPEGDNSLDNILKLNNIETVDILSIDIDGDDYYIFKNLEFRPRVIICEFNPTVPCGVEMVGIPGSNFGCSSASLIKMAQSKQYSLVAMTDANCIFVENNLYSKFEMYNTNYEDIFMSSHLNYMITDFKGNYTFLRSPAYGFKKPLSTEILSDNDNKTIQFYNINNNKFELKKVLKRIKNNSFIATLLSLGMGKEKKDAQTRKEQYILDQQKKYGCDVFIETGTYLGDTINAVNSSFKKTYSIEISKELFRRAKKRFSNTPNVFLFNGDSGELLSQIINKVSGDKILFWLDGHFSGGITQKGKTDTPVCQEIHAILNSNIENCIILIDDALLFNGTNGYPTFTEVKDLFKTNATQIDITNNIITIIYKKI